MPGEEIDAACRFLAQHIEAVRTDLLQVVGGGSIAARAKKRRAGSEANGGKSRHGLRKREAFAQSAQAIHLSSSLSDGLLRFNYP